MDARGFCLVRGDDSIHLRPTPCPRRCVVLLAVGLRGPVSAPVAAQRDWREPRHGPIDASAPLCRQCGHTDPAGACTTTTGRVRSEVASKTNRGRNTCPARPAGGRNGAVLGRRIDRSCFTGTAVDQGRGPTGTDTAAASVAVSLSTPGTESSCGRYHSRKTRTAAAMTA
jgi:hypothetical protein